MSQRFSRAQALRRAAVLVLGAASIVACGSSGSRRRSDAEASDGAVADTGAVVPADDIAGGTDDTAQVDGVDDIGGAGDDVAVTDGVDAATDDVGGTDGGEPDATTEPEDVAIVPDTTVPPEDVGPPDPCTDGAIDATVYGVNQGEVGDGVVVHLDRVIATSRRFLVSHSKTTGSCLWGMFVSARVETDGLTPLDEAAPFSGLLLVSFGESAPGDAPCVAGDVFPPGLTPGDELEVVGKVQTFISSSCANQPNPPSVGMRQLSQVCLAKPTGQKRPVPTPALLTDEAQFLSGATGAVAEQVHARWQGARVRVESMAADASSGAVVGKFGAITLTPGPVTVADKLFYSQPGLSDVCAVAPVYSSASVFFNYVEGFHFLDFCTWTLAPTDRCAGYSPPSDDCGSTGTLTCEP